MKQKYLLFVAFTLLTFFMLTRVARAQLAMQMSAGVNNPMRRTTDSVPGIQPGWSFKLQPGYTFGSRMSMNVTVGYVRLNTGHGFSTLAQQNGYTREKGFALSGHSGGMIEGGLGVGYNLLPTGFTDCGQAKPSLILGIQGGAFFTAGKIEGAAKTKEGVTAFTLSQTGKSTVPYYGASLQLLYPVSSGIAIATTAAWRQTTSDLSLQQSSNGNTSIRHFTYSDLQLSVGVQMSFKGHNEKGIKRSVPWPAAMTEGQPIGGIVVKGGVNPGTKPGKPHAMVAGSPIGGIVVKGGVNPGTKSGKPHAMVAGSPIGGIVVKGGVNPGTKSGKPHAKLVYAEDSPLDNPALLEYLGVDQLIIAKGEYAFDYGDDQDMKVIVHLHAQGIVHRDLAARSFTFDGTDPEGKPGTYTIEPMYVDGVAKDILVTYKGIQEKGIK